MTTLLITGATSGIGKALATLAASKGYQVIACGRNEQALAELSQHSNITTKQFDVSDHAQVTQQLDGIQLDIAVLNAGVCEYVDTNEFDAALFQRVFDANFFGVVNCVEALLPSLSAGNQLVIVDSLARLLPFTRSQAYGASKAAVHYFSQSLKVDLSDRGIQVQSVSPGFIETPLTDKNDFEMPMKMPVEEAAKAFLSGIEKQHRSIYFPTLFSLILRTLSRLPDRFKITISKKIKSKQ